MSDGPQLPQQGGLLLGVDHVVVGFLPFGQGTAVCSWQLTLLVGGHHQARVLVLQSEDRPQARPPETTKGEQFKPEKMMSTVFY